MSLLGTLTKVAIGIAVAKGMDYATSGARTSTGRTAPANRVPPSPGNAPSDTGMGGIMDEILGAGKARTTKTTGRTQGGLEDLLKGSTTRTRTTAPSGGLEDMLGSILGGGASSGRSSGGQSSGGLGDLLGGMLGGASGGQTAGGQTTGRQTSGGQTSGGLGDLLGAILGGASASAGSISLDEPAHKDEAEAAILLRAMIQAAKADGQLDAGEKTHLMAAVSDATKAEIAFINQELSTPVDIDALLADVPRGMEEKVYTVSLMAITLDQKVEAQYLHNLATALGLSPDDVNPIHDHLKAPRIY